MKILKNNYKVEEVKNVIEQLYPRKIICESCKSELEYEKSDLRIGEYGLLFLDCPCCKHNNVLDEEGIILTKNNVQFPTHFHHTSVETGAKDTCDNENIKKHIHEAIDYLRRHKDEDWNWTWYTAYGNLYIRVDRFNGDECYYVTVSNDYYTTDIPFELEDF